MCLSGGPFAQAYCPLYVSVKPFADVIRKYIRRDRHYQVKDIRHPTHPLPVASLGRGSVPIIAGFYKFRNCMT